MYDFSIPMALVDYIPVALFSVTMVILLKDLYSRMCKGSFTMFAAGMVNILAAGFLKATWKLLYAANICDFQALNNLFLPLQSLGFLLAGLALILALGSRKTVMAAVAPPVFGGTLVFIAMMVLGLGAVCTGLSILAAKMKKKWVIAIFAVAFVAYLGMGYMSSKDSTSAIVNWIEQSINCLGQGLMLAGVLVLHKAGLAEFDWRK